MAERKSADAAVAELFPDMAAMRSTERADMADAYLCFLGQCFAKFARASWYDSPVGRERSFYPDVNPALHYGFKGSTDQTAWQLMEVMFEEAKEYDYGLFSVMVDFMGEYKEECKFVPE
ncbi:hypothetical protein ACWDYH_09265 [Nocardia goodfellowii]